MVEFNLMPWRYYLRQRKNQHMKYIFASSIVILFLCGILYFYVKTHHRVQQHQSIQNTKPIHAAPQPAFKYVGYIRQGERFLALILLPNGTLINAEQDALLSELHGRVVSVDEKKIVIKIVNQLVRVSYAAKN